MSATTTIDPAPLPEETEHCACQHRRQDHKPYPEDCKHCGCPSFVEDW